MKKVNEIILGRPYFNVIGSDVLFIDSENKISSIRTGVLIRGIFYSFIFFRNKIWVTDNEDSTSRVYSFPDISLLYQFKNTVSPRLDIFHNELSNSIFCLCRDTSGKFWGKFDTTTFQAIEKYPIKYGLNGLWKVLNDSLFLSVKDSTLSCHSLEKGDEVWQVNIIDMECGRDTIEKNWNINKLITFEDFLVIESTEISLRGIDIHTGQVLWTHHFDNRFFFTSSQEGRNIHVIQFGTYYEIDIETGEILRQKSLELELKARDCSPASHTAPAVNEKYIVIAPGFKPKALLIDRETLEIVQELDLKGSYVNNSEILQFHDNRLYILDAHNNLHIFEDE